MKECGPCRWCCFFPSGNGLKKQRNEWCEHIISGIGCGIYMIRPECCRTFECVWKQDKFLKLEFRPDRCGVMFEIPHGTQKIVGLVDPARPNAWKKKNVQQLIRKFIKAGYPVSIRTKHDSSNLQHRPN